MHLQITTHQCQVVTVAFVRVLVEWNFRIDRPFIASFAQIITGFDIGAGTLSVLPNFTSQTLNYDALVAV